jgi:hypothetical protein
MASNAPCEDPTCFFYDERKDPGAADEPAEDIDE